MNYELPDVQAGFRKGTGTKDQIANIHWIIKKAREFHKNIYFCFIDYAKAFDCVDHNKLWKILKEMGTADHLTCLLRNLYAGQEAAVRTGHGLKVREKKYCVSGNEKYVGVLIFLSDKVDLKNLNKRQRRSFYVIKGPTQEGSITFINIGI